MRYERTGRGDEIVERLDVTACSSCGQPFQAGRYTLGWAQCTCTDRRRGHGTVRCRRPGCAGVTFDPPCTRPTQLAHGNPT